jgi:hypothetical protein
LRYLNDKWLPQKFNLRDLHCSDSTDLHIYWSPFLLIHRHLFVTTNRLPVK